jgi:hypothetical protein
MAVELAKVSLWINSAVEDKPLNFLDHHIKCGNSLIGTNSELVEGEFPVDAYETSGGRDWHVGNEIRKRVRSENKERSKGSSESSLQQWGAGKEEYVDIAERLDEIEEEDTEDIEKKRELYNELQQSEAYQQEKLAYDIWTAAFYWPMDGSAKEYPSPSTIEKIRRNPDPDDGTLQELIERATKIAEEQRFFHWELEFLEVFGGDLPGFDCILGNPPWDKIKVEEKEWFRGRVPEIAESDSKGHRSKLINELEDSDPNLYSKWRLTSKRSSQTSKFIRESGRYPLSGSGEINTYSIFTELSSEYIVNPIGRTGIIVKTGIATDYRTRDLFATLVNENRLVSLYDFENTERIFSDVGPEQRFCLLTLVGDEIDTEEMEFSFYSINLDMLREDERKYSLSKEELLKINPNTKTCPRFENNTEKKITSKIYDGLPVLINEEENENPWGIEYHRMYDMTTDSELFEDNTLESLQNKGYDLQDNSTFTNSKRDYDYYPLYEAKFIQQFDHRFGTFEDIPREQRLGRKAETKNPSPEEKSDPDKEIVPRYWICEKDFENRYDELDWGRDWIFAFRGITNTRNFRTAVGTITPFVPHGNSAPVITFDRGQNTTDEALVFTSLFNSFVFDFTLRQSMGETNLNLYVLKQLPMPSPRTIRSHSLIMDGSTESLEDFLIHHTIRLVWTSHALDSLSASMESDSGPFVWKVEDRRERRAKIDAAIAQIYRLERNEFEYILDDFEILRNREIEEYDEYLTKSKCLEYYDKIELNRA